MKVPRPAATASIPAAETSKLAKWSRQPATVTAVLPGSAPAAPAVPQSLNTGTAPAPAAAVVAPAPAAAATPSVITALHGAITNLVDSSLNWLNGLPASPVTELLSGAQLLVRRNLERTAATPAASVVSTSQTNQTFVVSTLADSGAGSLRQAILDANAAAGADAIRFGVAGTISVGSAALPSVTDTVVIDGVTAPGYSQSPVVRIDFQNTDGLTLAAGADGSQIRGLSLVDAAGAGVTIAASDTTLAHNYIGLWGDGTTVEANRGDGVLILAGANRNSIGIGPTDSFLLSNVISGNRGNGITIQGNDNVVQSNYIGTSSGGTVALGNRGNGIQITAGAAGNLIGGDATGGNHPTPPDPVVVRPPQGNLISGNSDNGVLIDDGATGNRLSGNFVGTDPTGNAALGNGQDGVAIVNANGNELVGTSADLKPFEYYNVLSGNGGNGLRITNSDETTVWANFFGIGADNTTAVANGGDGMLVNGDSLGVKAGGPIPLGNVMAGNRRYGIEIADTAGGVVLWNEFTGIAAFGRALGNGAGGIRVTSSNPYFNPENRVTLDSFEPTNPSNSNEIRTSLVAGNTGNGIEFLGDAHGAQIRATAIGTDETIAKKVPNTGNGIVIGGNSSNISIGGFAPSIEYLLSDGFGVHVGANDGWGIVIQDKAHDISVVNTRVGLGAGIQNEFPLPNAKGGIKVGPGTSNITIGGRIGFPDPLSPFNDEIALNGGPGLQICSAKNVAVEGTGIKDNDGAGIDVTGNVEGTTVKSSTISANGGSGVRLKSARGITVGGSTESDYNIITDNDRWGILASGWSRRSALTGNTVSGNASGQINTTFSTLRSPTVTIKQIFDTGLAEFVTGVRGAGWGNVVLTFSAQQEPDQKVQAGLYVGPFRNTATAAPLFPTPNLEGVTTVTTSTFYGPNTHHFNPRLIPRGQVQAVGSYQTGASTFDQGMIYRGTPDGSTGTWQTINVPSRGADVVGNVSACEGKSIKCSVAGTIAHSTMGDLVVGNYDLTLDGEQQDPLTINAFIYNTATKKYTLLGSNGDPFGALDNFSTIYGVWQNGGQNSSLYTLAGGTGRIGLQSVQKAFLVTYDASTGQYGEPAYYTFQGAGGDTHFEGVTQVPGGFSMAGETLTKDGTTTFAAFVPASIPALPFRRNVDTIRYGSPESAVWAPVNAGADKNLCPSGCLTTTANTIYQNKLMGVFVTDKIPQTYLATLTGRFGLPWWYL